MVSDAAPTSDVDAQFSVQYACAMALIGLSPGREWYDPQVIADPRVAGLSSKSSVEIDPVAEKEFWERRHFYTSTATISLTTGDVYTSTADFAPGHWQRPMQEGDVIKKFLANLGGTSLQRCSQEFLDVIMRVDEAPSLNRLCHLLFL
ncbi:hypothetical protein ACE103_08750 [Bradyrhizobium sp. ma5]|uniref:hypothetical protein n=1 Tax=Bradyrhizobium sp. ma5 TaxID=3344828 RepID=UPI0035D43568